MSEGFYTTCVTNEHARVPTPSYQGDPSRISLRMTRGVIVMKAKLPLFKIEPRVGRRGRVLIR